MCGGDGAIGMTYVKDINVVIHAYVLAICVQIIW